MAVQPYTAPQPGEELTFTPHPRNVTLDTTPFELETEGWPSVAAHRRELGGCRFRNKQLEMTGCCGTRRFCITSRVKVSGSLRLKITAETAYVFVTGRIQLQGPGGGLSSIDKTLMGSLKVDYGSATSLCDLVPGLKDKVIGSIGGGSTEICALGKCRTFDLPSTNGIKLYHVLPCDRLAI